MQLKTFGEATACRSWNRIIFETFLLFYNCDDLITKPLVQELRVMRKPNQWKRCVMWRHQTLMLWLVFKARCGESWRNLQILNSDLSGSPCWSSPGMLGLGSSIVLIISFVCLQQAMNQPTRNQSLSELCHLGAIQLLSISLNMRVTGKGLVTYVWILKAILQVWLLQTGGHKFQPWDVGSHTHCQGLPRSHR